MSSFRTRPRSRRDSDSGFCPIVCGQNAHLLLFVVPAKAGIHFLIVGTQRPYWVPLASAARGVLSVSAKSTQKPLRLAWRFRQRRVAETSLRCSPITRRRELARPCARTCAPCSRDRLRFSASCNGALMDRMAGHPWPRLKQGQMGCFVPPRAQEVRRTAPLEHGERTTEMPAGWRTGSGPIRRRSNDGPSAHPGVREPTRSTRWAKGASAGWPSLYSGHPALRPSGRLQRSRAFPTRGW